MSNSVLNVKVRTSNGKKGAKAVRNEGLIPAVLYGMEMEPVALRINHGDLKIALDTEAGVNTLLEINLDDDKSSKVLSLIKDYQVDPISSDTLHIDFHSIDINEKIEVTVPINVSGRAKGVREGGNLEQLLREIELGCLPTNIPNSIEIDVTELEIGQSIYVRDLELGKDVEAIRSEDEMVVGVAAARAIVEEEETTEEAAATEESSEESESQEG